jgi:hypothetical protein
MLRYRHLLDKESVTMHNDAETITLSSRQPIPPEYANWQLPDAIQSLAGKWNTLCLVGGPGSRKTTQLWTIRRVSRDPVHVMSEAADIDAHRFSMPHTEAWSIFRGILCVDDIGYKKPNDWNIQVLYTVLNHRRANGLRTILTTNHEEKKIAEMYGDHIASRMFGDKMLNVGSIDFIKKTTAASWNEQPRQRIVVTEGKPISQGRIDEAARQKQIIAETAAHYRKIPPTGPTGRKWYLWHYGIAAKGISDDVLAQVFSFADYVERIDKVAAMPEKARTQDALLAAFGLHLSPGKAPEPVRAPAPSQSITDLMATLL